jgi:hypothetical protein
MFIENSVIGPVTSYLESRVGIYSGGRRHPEKGLPFLAERITAPEPGRVQMEVYI